MDNVFVKPAPLSDAEQKEFGRATRLVPDPHQAFRPLAPEGEFKPLTSYWSRRLRDKDVIEAEPPKKQSEPAPIGAATPATQDKPAKAKVTETER